MSMHPCVLPVVAALGRQIHCRTSALRELASAGEEIRMNVSLRHRSDSKALGRGDFDVALDVALGIDDQRFTRPLATDDVRGLCKCRVIDLSKQHWDSRCSQEG